MVNTMCWSVTWWPDWGRVLLRNWGVMFLNKSLSETSFASNDRNANLVMWLTKLGNGGVAVRAQASQQCGPGFMWVEDVGVFSPPMLPLYLSILYSLMFTSTLKLQLKPSIWLFQSHDLNNRKNDNFKHKTSQSLEGLRLRASHLNGTKEWFNKTPF